MKIYIQTDIEGCAGFCYYWNSQDKSEWNRVHQERMQRLLTNEVNAAVTGAFEAGADEVTVNDSHGSGYNIYFEDLDPRCEIIHGANCSGPHWMPFLDHSYDAMVLIGMHAMLGTECAICPHSKWDINNGEIYLSEGSMAAAIAGDFGIPTIMASGDDKVIAELKEKIPEINGVIVKEAISPHQAKSLIPAKACKLIKEAVKKGIKEINNIKPFVISGPVSVELWESEMHMPPFEKMMNEPVEADTINDAFMKYEINMPWTNFNRKLPYGYQYPPAKIKK